MKKDAEDKKLKEKNKENSALKFKMRDLIKANIMKEKEEKEGIQQQHHAVQQELAKKKQIQKKQEKAEYDL